MRNLWLNGGQLAVDGRQLAVDGWQLAVDGQLDTALWPDVLTPLCDSDCRRYHMQNMKQVSLDDRMPVFKCHHACEH